MMSCKKIVHSAVTMWLLISAVGNAQTQPTSDLWYFDLHGPVKRIVIKGRHLVRAEFDRSGQIIYMQCDGERVTVHRNKEGRIDSTTTIIGRLDDNSNTRYRLRATDERGNWMARKTQQKPYVIGTEYCETQYYE